jgi:Chalcone isomerase-like
MNAWNKVRASGAAAGVAARMVYFLMICIALAAWDNAHADESNSARPATTTSTRFAPTSTLHGQTLVLNGTGTRYRAIFRVYDAALYTPEHVKTSEQLFATTRARRLHAVALRDIDTGDLGRMLMRGIEQNNSPADVRKHLVAVSQMGTAFGRFQKIAAGHSFGIDYVPQLGTVFLVDGVAQGEPVKDPSFFPFLMSVWFGPVPADLALRDALLGTAAREERALGL